MGHKDIERHGMLHGFGCFGNESEAPIPVVVDRPSLLASQKSDGGTLSLVCYQGNASFPEDLFFATGICGRPCA